MDIFYSILIGIASGIFAGFFGVGGGIIMIPLLIFIFNHSQHMAQGTSLAAMIPPIGILATYKYWKEGNANLKVALFIALGFVFGAYFGAYFANFIPTKYLKKIFGIFLLIISLRLIIK